MTLLGAVLAGGQSRRFGSDKALALLGGRPLIAHAIEALGVQVDAVIVCGREWGDWVPDRPGPGLGPLGGIAAALHTASARGYAAVLTAPCDIPVLPAGIAARLGDGPAYFAEMPVIGLWPASLAAHLDAWLAESSDLSVRGWGCAAGACLVPLSEELPNLNTVESFDKFVSDQQGVEPDSS
jgi:molybdopterin-guanine dinucleotide biosynthesis protein A